MMYASGNVALAFGLVIAAGMSTCIGSCLVFCTNLANARLLAGSLGMSAGVMLYVSFAEIFSTKSVQAFEEYYKDDPNGDAKALRQATYCFFGGMVAIALLNWLVHLLEKHAMGKNTHPVEASTASDSGLELPTAQALSGEEARKGNVDAAGPDSAIEVSLDEDSRHGLSSAAAPGMAVPNNVQEIIDRNGHAGLNKMGIMTGLAIAIHNFPEGLATFVAALAEPKAGVALAIAIALHNIPEGICVAMPVYYATGSKLKGFFWSFLSGITEPIGGIFGYLVLWNSVTPLSYAIMFGIVGGMMVYISLRDLLPTALRYDPGDKVTTLCLFLGMVVMAASLLVFTI
mmetsp:Transcript_17984/g.46113  ORF Transcript_17984/g.46113 Transcript_17984/m.46113 type:complete len:344 (+) Transcript_17984:292-1323(+)